MWQHFILYLGRKTLLSFGAICFTLLEFLMNVPGQYSIRYECMRKEVYAV